MSGRAPAGSPNATAVVTGRPGTGVGMSVPRPDGTLKVTGEFAFSSDLWMADMLWGATLRSPHPRARIRAVDLTGALRLPGVAAVLTHDDVPGQKTFGLEAEDQPVLAVDEVRYQGEPVVIVAADHPETARRAAAAIAVEYEVLAPVTDAEAALLPGAVPIHPGGNLVRHVRIRRGDPHAPADIVVSGSYEVGMQDQAFLGPESGLAVPSEDGGIELFVATQWLHVDQAQIATSLGLPGEKVRLVLAGVGGAFGAREDLSMQIHACLLALHTGRPVKMVYSREESFFGHVHRHPAKLYYQHAAMADGTLVSVTARTYLDGGAYTSSSPAVAANAATLGAGPYQVPNVSIDVYAAFTNNPPCGAMRGFGAVQACFAYESQMDELARRLGIDPVEVRIRNAMSEGSVMPTGQMVDSAAPVAELLRRVSAAPLPPGPEPSGPADPKPSGPAGAARSGSAGPAPTREPDLRELPGGVSNTTHGEGVVRGVGFGIGIKNVGFSEGFDDYSTARVRLEVVAGEPAVTVHTAAAEVGQGLVTVQAQIARTELGVENVVIHPADTTVGSAGSSSASRQTYVTGGAVRAACAAVRDVLFGRVARRYGVPLGDLTLAGGKIGSGSAGILADLASLLGNEVIEESITWRHRPTHPIDPETGQLATEFCPQVFTEVFADGDVPSEVCNLHQSFADQIGTPPPAALRPGDEILPAPPARPAEPRRSQHPFRRWLRRIFGGGGPDSDADDDRGGQGKGQDGGRGKGGGRGGQGGGHDGGRRPGPGAGGGGTGSGGTGSGGPGTGTGRDRDDRNDRDDGDGPPR